MAGLVLFIALMAFSILGRLYYVSIQLRPELVAAAREKVIQEREIPASRGNIYSADGQLLATSMPVYELRWDAAVVDPERLNADLAQTAKSLALLLPEKICGRMDHLPAPAAQQQATLCPDCEELELLPLPQSGPNTALRRQQVQIQALSRKSASPV